MPSTLLLDELHGVLQAVFGCSCSHLHRFTLGDNARDDRADHFLRPSEAEEGEDDGVPACDVRLDEVLAAPGDRLLYTCDYGTSGTTASPPSRSARPVEGVRCTAAGARRGRTAAASGTGTPARHRSSTLSRRGRPGAVEVERALSLDISSCCGTCRCCRPRTSSATWSSPLTWTDPSLSAEPPPAMHYGRYVWLVDRVDDGLPLTAAGWLSPAVVTAMDAPWPEDL